MQIIKNSQQYPFEAQSIQYLNSIGAIVDNCLLLYKHDYPMITIDSIKKVEIHKSTGFFYRLILVLSTIPLFYTLFALNLTYFEKLLTCIYIALLLGLSYFIIKQKYTVVIRKTDTVDIEFEVDPYGKEDAKRFMRQINRTIKHLKMEK